MIDNFEQIYKSNKKFCKNILNRKGLNHNSIIFDDIYQDTMMVVFKNLNNKDFVLTTKLSSYIASVASNLFLKEINNSKYNTDIESCYDVYSEEYEYNEKDIKITNLQYAITKLSKGSKDVIDLYLEEHDTDSMMNILNLKSKDVLKSKKSKAVQQLKNILHGEKY